MIFHKLWKKQTMNYKHEKISIISVLLTIILLIMVTPVMAVPSFSPWAPALSLSTVPGTSPELNTEFLEGCPFLSRDGLELYIASNRPGGLGGLDIWIADRSTPDGPFGAPYNPGAPINSEFNDFCPSPLRDGKGFVFVSNRPGGCGGSDIYITRKHPTFGWQEPVNLGCEVNSSSDEAGPVLVFEELGPPTLYFSSTRDGVSNLYKSRMTGDWTFGPADLIPGVNSAFDDFRPFVSRDGRELYFDSNRPGGLGGFDIWSSNRDSISSEWSLPINLGPDVNSPANETRASLSWDGLMLLFGSDREGGEGSLDIYYSTRERIPSGQ
jgi:hypothetical protein